MYNHGNMAHVHPGNPTTATTLLQGAGLRLTPQRLAIAHEVLAQDHPTAAEVYEAVRSQFPTMGLATVYATLNVMVEHGCSGRSRSRTPCASTPTCCRMRT